MSIVQHAEQPWRENRPGSRVRTIGAPGVLGTSIVEQECQPGVGAPSHTHEFDEIVSIDDGSAEVWLGDTRQVVGPGVSVFVPAGVVHGFRNVGQTLLRVRAVIAATELRATFVDAAEVDWTRRARVADSILETAGLTPVVRLRRVVGDASAKVLVKLEFFGPSGSVKDRILPRLVAEAEARGELRRGMTIIEGTTGNTGIATAQVAAALGYPAVIVMPEGMSDERKKTIQAYGAELILTPGGESDVDLVVDRVAQLKAAEPGRFWEVAQFNNPSNPTAHAQTTGPEIWAQTAGDLDAFVAAQGTGGTISGVAHYLRQRKPLVKIFAVEPAECDILSGGGWGAHRIEGIGDGFVPRVLDLRVLDGVIRVTSDEAIDMARRLAREEGIFCGISSGCNVVAALKLAAAQPELRTIVTIVNDNGLRYLSTELCGAPADLDVPDRAHDLDDDSRRRLAEVRLEVIR